MYDVCPLEASTQQALRLMHMKPFSLSSQLAHVIERKTADFVSEEVLSTPHIALD